MNRQTAHSNKAHFVLGDDASSYETTYAAGLAAGVEAGTSSASGLSPSQVRPAASLMGKTSKISFGTDPVVYETSAFMPPPTRAEPSAGGSTTGIRPSASPPSGTTATKRIGASTIVLGYEAPEDMYVSAAMAANGENVKMLNRPYVPALRPRYVKDHPALRPEELTPGAERHIGDA